ncbi:hypothetical protein EVAR_65052_1 [Eumeta japonica]|uniref:Uncharacterized protein n=1 Tax=Eumeta variegata TaxID=151549 RepID=A0A4C2ADE6_EUMVA|nr:hypothetical protein EVAR_65052_1 [Eumeta japonica]
MQSLSEAFLLLLPFWGFCELIENSMNVENDRYIRQLDSESSECCPCPQSVTNHDSIASSEDKVASSPDSWVRGQVALGDPEFIGDCTCGIGDADCTPSGSTKRIGEARDAWPVMRITGDEKNNTTLLRPEVSLASSVLETLREATEEEYEDALAKDERTRSDPSIESTLKHFTMIIGPTDTFKVKDVKTNVKTDIHKQDNRYENSDLKETKENAIGLLNEMTESHIKSEEARSANKPFESLLKLNKNEEGFKINILNELLMDLQSKRKNKFKNVDVLPIDTLNEYNEGVSKTSDSNLVLSKHRVNGKKDPSNIRIDTPFVNESLFDIEKFDIFKTMEDEQDIKISPNDDQQEEDTNNENVINSNANEFLETEMNVNDFDYSLEDNDFLSLNNITISQKKLKEEKNQQNVQSIFVNDKQMEMKPIFNDDIVDTDIYFADVKEKETNFENVDKEDDQKESPIKNLNSDDEIQNENMQADLYSHYPESSSFEERKLMKVVENQTDNENYENKNGNTEMIKTSFKDIQRNSNFSLNDDIQKESQIQNNERIEHMRSGEVLNKTNFSSEENETVNESPGTAEGLLHPNKITNGNTDIEHPENTSDLSTFKNDPKEKIEKDINKTNIIKNSEIQKLIQNKNSIAYLTDKIPKNAMNNTEKMVSDASNSIRHVIAPPNPLFRNLGKQSLMESSLSNDLIIQPESLINKIKNKMNMQPLINLEDLTLNKLELPSIKDLRSKVDDALGLSSLQHPLQSELPMIKLPLLDTTKAISLLGEPQDKLVSNLNLDLFQLNPTTVNRLKLSQPSLKEKLENLHPYRLNIPLEQPILVKPLAVKSIDKGNNDLRDATLALKPESVLEKKFLNRLKEFSSKQANILENETKSKKPLLTSNKSLYPRISKKVAIDPKTVKVPKLRPQFLQSPSLLDSKLGETRRMKSSIIKNRTRDEMKRNRPIKNLDSTMRSNEVLGQANDRILQIQPSESRQNTLMSTPNVFKFSPGNERDLKASQSNLRLPQTDLSNKRNLQFLDRSKPLEAQSKSDLAQITKEETDIRKLKSMPVDLLKFESFSPKLLGMETADSNQEMNKVTPDKIQNELQPVRFAKLKETQPTVKKAPLDIQVIGLDNDEILKQSLSNDNNDNGDNQIILYNNGKFVGILSSILAKLISIDKNLSKINFKEKIINPYVNEKLNVPNIRLSARDPEVEDPEILKKSKRPILMNFKGMKSRKVNNIKSNDGDTITDSTSKTEVESPSPRKVIASSKQRQITNKNILKSNETKMLGDQLFATPDTITTTPKAVLLDSPLLLKLKEAFDGTTKKILENSSPKP